MDEKGYESLKIENIVASGVIADAIDLESVSGKIKTRNTTGSEPLPHRSQRSHPDSPLVSGSTGIRDQDQTALRSVSVRSDAGVDTYSELPGRCHEHSPFLDMGKDQLKQGITH